MDGVDVVKGIATAEAVVATSLARGHFAVGLAGSRFRPQAAFGWDDDHLYAFWPSGKFWDREPGAGFGRPGFCRDSGDRSSRIRLDRLGLEVGQIVAYVFDFGDEWRVRLKLVDVREAGINPATAILESRGAAPPQYGWDEDELGDVA